MSDVKKSATETKQTFPVSTKTKQQIEDRLIRARVKLLIAAPFFGNLATRLRFIDASKWCPTAATDGRNFYYNKDFVDALKDGEIEFLVGHEVLHCVYDHMNKDMIGNRDRRLCNIAQDYVINADLVDASIGEQIKLVEICFDWKYRGKHWLEVYDMLFEEAEKDGRVQYVENFDMHLDGGDDSDGDGQGGSDGDNDGTNGPIKYTKEEREQMRSEMESAVIQAAKAAAGSGAGNLPGGVKRMLDALLNPQLDWRELLAMQIQSVIKSDYTWMRPSRKGLDAGMYLPGMDREQTIDIALCIDTSGSISPDMLLDFVSEVYGIISQYNDFKIHLWCFDTAVHNPVVITPETLGDLESYELAGFGGTDFDVNFDFMKDNGILPKKFVMFTDMHPWNSWGDETYCDTLFIAHTSGNEIVAPYGITVQYTRNR